MYDSGLEISEAVSLIIRAGKLSRSEAVYFKLFQFFLNEDFTDVFKFKHYVICWC